MKTSFHFIPILSEKYNKRYRPFISHNRVSVVVWLSDFLMGIQERMVDALTLKGDEGRSVAAISFGEVPSNL